ncbi:MAG: histidine phosphatase family protein [Gemmatimonadaceae bacterium]|nr:histidine phosphatase family protein [Gemmatimonadaceae bacterium]
MTGMQWRRLVPRAWRAAVVPVAMLMAVTLPPSRAMAQPSLVILVRHGEKQPTPADDPSLSEAGVARAQALAEALSHTTPSTILVSARKRTAETAVPVAKATGVTPTVIALDASHVKAVAEAVMKAKGVVLVVGHSNTVPAIVNALGGPKLPDLCDASYATMFLVTPAANGLPTQVVRASYGAPDAPAAANCAGMTPK